MIYSSFAPKPSKDPANNRIFLFPGKGQAMREKQSLFKMPGENPVIIWLKPNPKSIIDKVGGAFYRTDVQLSTGKTVVLFYYQMSVRDGCEYNFTICPTEDKRTWVDICGPVLVMAPDDADLDLEVEECEELFRVPYEY